MARAARTSLRAAVVGTALATALGTVAAGLVAPTAAAGVATRGTARTAGGSCGPGARTLAAPGSRLYPQTGNGGYTSVHTDVHLVYDARRNRFLPGTHVVLTQRATRCLTSFSLDFERTSIDHRAGPDLALGTVGVDGRAARTRFARPAYPGDPHGPDDPDPRAHQASQLNPVGGPHHNPLPPACGPQLRAGDGRNARNGEPCPATKLIVTPRRPIPAGTTFSVRVAYTGRPGVHRDGDGTSEGWHRAPDGGFVVTEPLGTQAWMPLNNHPTAKPTYDLTDTVASGLTAVANGVLRGVTHDRTDPRFPHGSSTFHWHAADPTASYLVENSVGRYHLTKRVAADGRTYYQAQAAGIPAARQRKNRAVMDRQPDITAFESGFNGPYPFASDGVLVGTPDVGDEMEMQTMLAFDAGLVDLPTLYHENMHLWWGDHVGEASYQLTFYKEGLATVSEYLLAARKAERAAGGPGTARGRAAFEGTLTRRFDRLYAHRGRFWTVAPSDPAPYDLFSDSAVYQRPAAAYLALRQILGHRNFGRALRDVQREYGGGTITEPQLEAAFAARLPVRTPACRARLDRFFTAWFDTAYPAGGGRHRPPMTGPGLAGPGFYGGGCRRPA